MVWMTNKLTYCKGIRNSCQLRLKCCRLVCAQYKYIQIFQALHGYTFRILHHFTSQLCNFTNFKSPFLAMLIDFALFPTSNVVYNEIVHWMILPF